LNLSLCIPKAQRFSRIYRWRKELIEHIFVSHALVGKIAQDHVTTDAADAAGPTPSIDDDPTKRRGAPGSTNNQSPRHPGWIYARCGPRQVGSHTWLI
jgi:hypothetical protein